MFDSIFSDIADLERAHGVKIDLIKSVTHWCDCIDEEFNVPGWGRLLEEVVEE